MVPTHHLVEPHHRLHMKDYRANSIDTDEVAHYEPPQLNLGSLQI